MRRVASGCHLRGVMTSSDNSVVYKPKLPISTGTTRTTVAK
jgi:hypothetical protein